MKSVYSLTSETLYSILSCMTRSFSPQKQGEYDLEYMDEWEKSALSVFRVLDMFHCIVNK